MLDEITGMPSWRLNIMEAIYAADRRQKLYKEARLTMVGNFFDSLFSVSNLWYTDQQSARQQFLNDPRTYTDPLLHVTSQSRYPMPYLEIRFGDSIHKRNKPLKSNLHRAIALDEKGLDVLAYIGKLSDTPQSNLDDIVNARMANHFVDLIFFEEKTEGILDEFRKCQLQDILGKQLISVY